jgi:hypothetical protein
LACFVTCCEVVVAVVGVVSVVVVVSVVGVVRVVSPVVVAVVVEPEGPSMPGPVHAYATPPPAASVRLDAATAIALRVSLIVRSLLWSINQRTDLPARESRAEHKKNVGPGI